MSEHPEPPADPVAPQPAASLRVRLMGSPEWVVVGRAPVPLTPKDAALAAVLALDGPRPRDTLCGLLWPDNAPHQAAASLRQRMSRLHRAMGAELVLSGEAVRLSAAAASIDVLELHAMPAEQLMACGELLAGIEFGELEALDRWLTAARARVAGWLAQALAAHAESLMRQHELRAALPLALRIVELDPLSEHAARRVMRLHYLRGDRGAGLEVFDRLAERLHDELGLKPGPETMQLWQTIDSAVLREPQLPQPVPASVMLPPVMVGRDAAWRALAQAWQTACVFVLVGEAGLGKSRLLREFLHGRTGVLVERARPGDQQLPFAVLGRVLLTLAQQFDVQVGEATRRELAAIQPRLGPAWPTAARPEVLRHALLEFLEAAAAAGLRGLVLDDMHDGDLATLEALRWLAQCPSLAAVRLGVAMRPPRMAAIDELLKAWMGDSQPPVRVQLEPLSPADLSALLATLALPDLVDPGVAAHLYRHAGGHPLYTLATLQDALTHGRDLRQAKLPDPPSVQALLDTRLQELPAHTHGLLQVAAVGGADLNAERAAAVMACRPLELAPAWQVLEAANVLRGEQFTHDLVHEAALRAVPLGLRLALHRRWAAVLEQDVPHAVGRVAAHWEHGERWAEAGRCWQMAGQAARQAGRLAEQRELFEHAARCHARAGDAAAHFEALFSRLDGLLLHQGGAVVLEVLPEVEALAETSRQRLRCRLAHAEALLHAERPQQALLQTAPAVQEARHHPDLQADAGALHALALAQSRHGEESLVVAREALEQANAWQARTAGEASRGATGCSAQQLRATNALAYALFGCGRIAEAVPVQRDAVVLAERLGDRAEAAATEGSLAALLAAVGDVPATYHHATQADVRQRQAGLGGSSTAGIVNHFVRGAAAAYLGRFDEALDALHTAVDRAARSAIPAAPAKSRLALANVWLTLGQPAHARDVLRELPDGMVPAMQMQAALVMARAAALDGAPQQRHWQTLEQLAAAHPDLPPVQSAWYEISFQGEPQAMLSSLARVRAEFEALGLLGTARALQLRELARWLELPGDAATAEALQRAQALVPHAQTGTSGKVYPPQAWLLLAQAFERAGLPVSCSECLAQGRQWVEAALARVPSAHRTGFLAVNPVNRALLAAPAAG